MSNAIKDGKRAVARVPTADEILAYTAITGAKNKSGIYHKTCFHLHTPASYDYKLTRDWSSEQYRSSSAEDVLKMCQVAQIILPSISVDNITEHL